MSALVFLRDFAKLKAGQHVLLIGASGGVGVFAVQLAKHFGAVVTGVASTDNVELVRSIGADTVIDYKREDFARSGKTYDLIVDTVGATTFNHAKAALSADGTFLPLEIGIRELVQSMLNGMRGGKKVVVGISGDSKADLTILAGLADRGAIRPVIDSTYPLDQIVDAHRRVDSRRKRGAVVVSVDNQAADRRPARAAA
jgi:NADPH:quinone reductase-like Zn-dependent oxidoreductase